MTAKTVVGGEGICKASWAALVGSNGADTPAATTLPGTVSQPIAASVTNDESQAALPAVADKEALPAVVIDVVTSSTPANQGLEPPQAAIIVADEKASEANVTTAAVPKVTGAETPAEKEKEQKTDQKSEPAVVLSPAAPAFIPPVAHVGKLSPSAPAFVPTLSPAAPPFIPKLSPAAPEFVPPAVSKLSPAALPFIPPSAVAQLSPAAPDFVPTTYQPLLPPVASISVQAVILEEVSPPIAKPLTVSPQPELPTSGDVCTPTTTESEQPPVQAPEQPPVQAPDQPPVQPPVQSPVQPPVLASVQAPEQLPELADNPAPIKETKAVIVTTVPDSNGNTVIMDGTSGGVPQELPSADPLTPPPRSTTPANDNSGRKQYDRDFLMQLANNPLSLQKPQLPNLEIVLPVAAMRASASAPQLGDLPAGEYVRGSPAARRGDSRRRELPTPKKVISISREPVKLHQAENAWTPGAKHKTVGEQEGSDDTVLPAKQLEALSKSVRSILNKLTPQKFDRLVEQFKELPIDTEEKLNLCTDLVFEKALDEPSFSVAYARMCKVLSMKKVPKADNSTTEVAFRSMLITRCQKEFEKDYITEEQRSAHARALEVAGDDEEACKRLSDEFAALELRQRRRSLGNIRFIGELFKQGMITGGIMHSIIGRLLKATDEESLESLCQFLTTVGQTLEKMPKPVNIPTPSMEEYFSQMAGIIREKKTSSRVRFLMQDVIDLRRNNWVSRRKETGPKTIEEIHKEAKREAAIIELADAAPMGPPPSNRRSDDRRRSRLEATSAKAAAGSNDDGWSNVPSKAAKVLPERLDSSRLRLSKVDTDQLQLGPSSARGFTTAWGRGSGAASKKTSQTLVEPPSPVRSTNRFQSLDDSDVSMPPPTSSIVGGYAGRASEPVRRSHSRSSSRSGYNSSSSRNPSSERRGGAHSTQPHLQPKPSVEGGNKLQGPANVDQEYLAAKFGPIIEEYLSNCDYADAVSSVCVLFRQDNIACLAELAVSSVLERSVTDQRKLGDFLARLVGRDSILSLEQVAEGLGSVLEIAEDMLVDIPKLWEYLGEILAPLFLESPSVDTFLTVCYAKLAESQLRDRFTVAVLAAVQRARPEALARILAQTGSRLDSHLSADIAGLLAANGVKLSDPVTNGESKPAVVGPQKYQQLGDKLRQIFGRGLGVNEELELVGSLTSGSSCIEPAVVRILVTSLLESVILGIGGPSSEIALDNQLLNTRAPILKIALDTKDSQKVRFLNYQLSRSLFLPKVFFTFFSLICVGNLLK